MKKMQKGFTLIELMIVVAIVAILAAIALPAYTDYMKRSKVSEAMAAAGACKTSVAEYAAARNALPEDEDDAGCSTTATQYVSGLTVADGVISVAIDNVDATNLDGKTIIMSPTSDAALATAAVDGDDIVGWHCGTDADSAYWKLLPASCRNEAL